MTTLTIPNLIKQQSHKNKNKLFLYFYQIVSVQQKFNIKYLQLSILDFIHFWSDKVIEVTREKGLGFKPPTKNLEK